MNGRYLDLLAALADHRPVDPAEKEAAMALGGRHGREDALWRDVNSYRGNPEGWESMRKAPVLPVPVARRPGADPMHVVVRFHHGLGDCAQFCRLLQLWRKRGYRFTVGCDHDREWLFRAAGCEILAEGKEGDAEIHPWLHPPGAHQQGVGVLDGNKTVWNLDNGPLPMISARATLWAELLDTPLDITAAVREEERDRAAAFMKGLPRPVVLLHAAGHSFASKKAIKPEWCAAVQRGVLAAGGSAVLIDREGTAEAVERKRVRTLRSPAWHWSDLPTVEQLAALLLAADGLVGIDSGPFHLAGLLGGVRAAGVFRPGLPAHQFSLPGPAAVYLQPAGWASADWPAWQAEYAEAEGPVALALDALGLAKGAGAGAAGRAAARTKQRLAEAAGRDAAPAEPRPVEHVLRRLAPHIHPDDWAGGYAQSGNYYEWYAGYAAFYRPRSVLEIGVRRGYSLLAMLAGHGGIERAVGLDNESYGVRLEEAAGRVRAEAPGLDLQLHNADTQRLERLDCGTFDLIHVDGDHTEAGAAHDLRLVLPHLNDGGVIVLDDTTNCPEVAQAGRRFLEEHPGLRGRWVPTYRGHLLITRPAA